MADDSAIRDFAAKDPHIVWKWRTRETAEGWEAEVSIGSNAIFGSGPAFYPTEQEALDRAAMWAIRHCGERNGGVAMFPNGKMQG